MLYPVIAVPGRVNGGLHEMLTVERLIVNDIKSLTYDNGPDTIEIKKWNLISVFHYSKKMIGMFITVE